MKEPRPISEGQIKTHAAVLKEKREKSGLSLETVHEATKIPLDVLRAIEEGYSIRNVSPFYYKGFLKIYANYLNVDVAQVIENYKGEELPKYIPKKIEVSPLGNLLPRVRDFFTPQRMKQLFIALAIIVGIVVINKIGSLIKNHAKTHSPPIVRQINHRKENNQTRPEPTVIKLTEKKEKAVAPQVQIKEEDAKSVAALPEATATSGTKIFKNVTLTVRAKKNSWLTVKADGETLFQSTLRAGVAETWLADNKIEISGKNINQLEFELNGRMIGTLGRADSRAKALVVTKDGLSVTK